MTFHQVKCFFGLHKWNQSRNITILDAFPPPFLAYENPKRMCLKCGKRQKWLPGYGGSEIGCWIGDYIENDITTQSIT